MFIKTVCLLKKRKRFLIFTSFMLVLQYFCIPKKIWPHCMLCNTGMRSVYGEKTSYKNNKDSLSQKDKLLQVCVNDEIKGAQTSSERICLCTQQFYNMNTKGQPKTFGMQIWKQSRRWSTLSHNWASLMNPPALALSVQQEESHPNTCLRWM